ncbi:hypothetical protein [Phyllobacterium zundukense]|nr:hypothetical protein [Phyllobacterium zundukense]ATU93874.1 hypothetical protein BLM14_14605 [Phyllobacterium zundukense]
MSEIRNITPRDIPAVANMFWGMFKTEKTSVPQSLVDYLSKLYLNPSRGDSDIISQVHIRSDGVLNGFIGSIPLRMSLDGSLVRAAICGPLMVEDHAADPLAGARLLRAFLAGPQDVSLSETANETSRIMWSKLRGTVLPTYSLEWVRVFRPAAFAIELAAGRFHGMRLLAPLAVPLDALGFKLASRSHPESAPGSEVNGFTDSDIDCDALVGIIPSLVERFGLRPAWEASDLRDILDGATPKSTYGPMHCRVVRARHGAPIGAYLYHGSPGRIARVLQILAMKEREGAVLDCLLDHARALGAVAIRARTQPYLLQAMMVRQGLFFQRSSTVVHSRDARVLSAFSDGNAFFNGLAGEAWNRLNGDDFN